MYRYFVAFQLSNLGFGNQEIHRAEKIKSITDIQEISRDLEQVLNLEEKSLVIMSFQEFD